MEVMFIVNGCITNHKDRVHGLERSSKRINLFKRFVLRVWFQARQHKIHYDSQSTLVLAKNLVHHGRTKHNDTKFYFIWNLVTDGDIVLRKIHTTVNSLVS